MKRIRSYREKVLLRNTNTNARARRVRAVRCYVYTGKGVQRERMAYGTRADTVDGRVRRWNGTGTAGGVGRYRFVVIVFLRPIR